MSASRSAPVATRRRALPIALLPLLLAATAAHGAPSLRPPVTRTEVVADTLHGVVIQDPYRWLEDQNSPATRAWIAEQERHYHAVMDAVPGRPAIRARLAQLLRTSDASLPTVRGDRMFFLKRGPEQDQRALYMRRDPKAADQLLLDPSARSRDHTESLRLLDASNDGTVLALGIQQGGEDEVVVEFLDVDTRKPRKETLPKARYFGVQFTADARAVYYSRMTPAGPRAFRHTMGAAVASDTPIFGDGLGPEKILNVKVNDEGTWLVLTVSHGSAGNHVDVYAKDLRNDAPIVTIVDDLDANFAAEFGVNGVYLKTNWLAPLGRILFVEFAHPEREHWHEVVKEAANPIGHWTPSGSSLLVEYLVSAVSMVYAFRGDGHLLGPVPIGGATGSVRDLRGSWTADHAYLSYESYVEPPRIFEIRARVASSAEWWKSEVPFDSDSFEVATIWYPSKNETMVPMMIAKKKDLDRSPHPVYLTGYGGFALNQTPRFRALTALWLESGGIVAVPNLHGGGEFGEEWHKAGMLANKQTVFDDFIAAGEYLVQKGMTTPDLLTISGQSNGGLLVGAALTQRPDLFRTVVCSLPLLDMLRYQKFLVARFWVPEYGSSDDRNQFEYLRAYSPYHHVSDGVKYPATLFVSGDSDTRVAPLHARKMTALLQAKSGGDAPILLHYDTKSGHSAGKPVSQQIEDDADVMQFLFWRTGMTAPAAGSGGGKNDKRSTAAAGAR